MKKRYSLLAICFYQFLFALPMQERQIDPEALSRLALELNIPLAADIIAETQKQWLRQAGQERWDLKELSSDQKQFVLTWASEEGFFTAWQPIDSFYDKALILGATTGHMQMRLDFLKQLWEEGVRFREVVWLTGERPLVPRVDQLTDRCSNESEAAFILWQETEMPEEMRKLPAVFISVPMKNEAGSPKRPNTKDTIIAWIDEEPEPCKALFISTQPFCGYQFAVIKSSLPETFFFDVAGPGAEPSSHPAAAAITLDSIARWIYQENLHE